MNEKAPQTLSIQLRDIARANFTYDDPQRITIFNAADKLDELRISLQIIKEYRSSTENNNIEFRLRSLEIEIRELKKLLGTYATKLDLEALVINIQSFKSNFMGGL